MAVGIEQAHRNQALPMHKSLQLLLFQPGVAARVNYPAVSGVGVPQQVRVLLERVESKPMKLKHAAKMMSRV
jgi:hypothetical protein